MEPRKPDETDGFASAGAEAGAWGTVTGNKIAEKLGFQRIADARGNEFIDKKGSRLSIRCARRTNTQMGLLHTMRERLDYIVGAFELEDGKFSLYRISQKLWEQHSRPGSPGSKTGHLMTMLSRGKLELYGTSIGVVNIT